MMKEKNLGSIVVISGPSGVGKDTVINSIINNSEYKKFPAYTTRPPRSSEVNGIDYKFISKEQFFELKKSKKFLDHIVVNGYHYGTPINEFEEIIKTGKKMVLHLAVKTALLLQTKVPNVTTIFLMPPAKNELVKRLLKRGTPLSQIEDRLREDPVDYNLAVLCDYCVVNYHDEYEEAAKRILMFVYERQTAITTSEEKTQPMIKAIVGGELKFYIYPLPSYAATGVLAAVEGAATDFSSWSPYGATIRRVYSSNDADITIFWIRDYGSEILGQAIFRAHLEVGLGSNNCLGDWRAFDPRTVKKILWHELGHSMGYGHSNNSNNIMYSVMDTRFEVESEISKVIPGGYFTTQPLCNAGAYSYAFKTDNPFTGFDLFVLLPGVDPKDFSEESSLSYSDCGAKGMQSYPGSCVVASGAKIYIGNTSISNAVKLSGKVINTDQSSWPDMTWDQNAYQYQKEEMDKYWNLFH